MKAPKSFYFIGFALWMATAITLELGTAGCGGGGGGSGSNANCNVAAQTGCNNGLVCRANPSGGTGCFCNPSTQAGCDSGKVCEEITDGTTGCFAAMVAKGDVFNCADNTAVIKDARVVALNANGSPISSVAVTDASGNYDLTVPTTRKPDGTPSGDNFTLRSDAATFQTFPSGLRQPIPVSASAATAASDGTFVVQNSLTNICLIALEAGAGTASIHGTVALPKDSAGALVVAESAPTAGFSAIADKKGDYKIFNLSAGTYSVNAYVKGVNYNPVSVTLIATDDKQVDLATNSNAPATLAGSVQLVNPGAGKGTSVILVVESTFNDALARGETPPGLRAPDPGTAPDITGAFNISGIPAGRYVVLAGFENDFLVRDPDTCISGTDIIHQAFASGDAINLSTGFKVTGSLDVISPGADGAEKVTTATPIFTWVDDSSEKSYLIQVFDSFGNKVWETTIPGVSGHNPSVTYNASGTGAGTGQALQSGQFYQFRVTSIDNGGCPISQTEDLKGVFQVP